MCLFLLHNLAAPVGVWASVSVCRDADAETETKKTEEQRLTQFICQVARFAQVLRHPTSSPSAHC